MQQCCTPTLDFRSFFPWGRLAYFGGITQIVQISHGIITKILKKVTTLTGNSELKVS